MKKHIPNILTSINLIAGWLAICAAFNELYWWSFSLILFAAIFDFLDGFVARKLNVQSVIGEQLDSFADFISFGIAPSMIVFNLSEITIFNEFSFPKLCILLAICLLPVLTSIRLAKFNISKDQNVNFIGLPSPAFALMIISISTLKEINYINTYTYISIAVFIGLLMVSNIKFIALKFKNFSFKDNTLRYIFILSSIICFVMLIFFAQYLLIVPIILLLYLLFSIVINFNS